MQGVLRRTVRLAAVAVITVVGAGACAFAPSGQKASGGPVPVSATGETGASAPPEPSPPPPRPPATTAPKTTPSKSPKPRRTTPKPAGCPTGEHQRAVEAALAELGSFGRVTVDGRQSPQDCAAIKRFQQRYGISPAAGRAGPTTADVARRLLATDTGKCDAGSGLTFCVDLTHQTVFAVRGGRVVLGPTVTRTGMAGGYQTPAGRYRVNFRNVKEWSNPYEVWLPYWQHFVNGMGFHETTTYIHNGAIGSHGCVNLLPADARALWRLGEVGTPVHVYGRRPGT